MTLRIGTHLCLWQRAWDEDVTLHVHRAAEFGFDGIEVSLFTLRHRDVGHVRREVERAGLAVTCSTGLGPQEDITSDDETVRLAGLDALRLAVRLARDVGSRVLCGVLFAPWGKFYRQPEYANARARSIDALRTIGEDAERQGLVLGVEVLNRYETSLINTAEQGRAFVDAVGRGGVGLHLDTYHMNIEERSIPAAIAAAGTSLSHFHCAESDRGVPGTGRLPWPEIVRALNDVGYTGWMVMECCTRSGTAVADTFNVWRDVGPDPDTAARDGLSFLRRLGREA